ncbi:UNVERIFIED_CONTAM: hypothetical protein Slati_4553000 [Sesamum latifolium]|uniref:Uncharacterized protein n=1 Tax=Sesamum latifolium TaxID=2727402 RepID=A0AAW2S3J8_9LAMI
MRAREPGRDCRRARAEPGRPTADGARASWAMRRGETGTPLPTAGALEDIAMRAREPGGPAYVRREPGRPLRRSRAPRADGRAAEAGRTMPRAPQCLGDPVADLYCRRASAAGPTERAETATPATCGAAGLGRTALRSWPTQPKSRSRLGPTGARETGRCRRGCGLAPLPTRAGRAPTTADAQRKAGRACRSAQREPWPTTADVGRAGPMGAGARLARPLAECAARAWATLPTCARSAGRAMPTAAGARLATSRRARSWAVHGRREAGRLQVPPRSWADGAREAGRHYDGGGPRLGRRGRSRRDWPTSANVAERGPGPTPTPLPRAQT